MFGEIHKELTKITAEKDKDLPEDIKRLREVEESLSKMRCASREFCACCRALLEDRKVAIGLVPSVADVMDVGATFDMSLEITEELLRGFERHFGQMRGLMEAMASLENRQNTFNEPNGLEVIEKARTAMNECVCGMAACIAILKGNAESLESCFDDVLNPSEAEQTRKKLDLNYYLAIAKGDKEAAEKYEKERVALLLKAK